jgi:hypothetical protein
MRRTPISWRMLLIDISGDGMNKRVTSELIVGGIQDAALGTRSDNSDPPSYLFKDLQEYNLGV